MRGQLWATARTGGEGHLAQAPDGAQLSACRVAAWFKPHLLRILRRVISVRRKIYCHSLATTDLVMGQLIDGIDPTAAANTRIAKALLSLMENRRMRR